MIIRCDDVFVDTDAMQFEKICQIVARYGFNHLIGVTPLGEGTNMWTQESEGKDILSKLAFTDNFRLKKFLGETCISNNSNLVELLKFEFAQPNTFLSLHGLHHYRYDTMPAKRIGEELSNGIELLNKIFGRITNVFVPPFNCWSPRTEEICKSLKLTLDKCTVGFDQTQNMSEEQIVQTAKKQSCENEVHYHPYRTLNLKKFEIYLQTLDQFRE